MTSTAYIALGLGFFRSGRSYAAAYHGKCVTSRRLFHTCVGHGGDVCRDGSNRDGSNTRCNGILASIYSRDGPPGGRSRAAIGDDEPCRSVSSPRRERIHPKALPSADFDNRPAFERSLRPLGKMPAVNL